MSFIHSSQGSPKSLPLALAAAFLAGVVLGDSPVFPVVIVPDPTYDNCPPPCGGSIIHKDCWFTVCVSPTFCAYWSPMSWLERVLAGGLCD